MLFCASLCNFGNLHNPFAGIKKPRNGEFRGVSRNGCFLTACSRSPLATPVPVLAPPPASDTAGTPPEKACFGPIPPSSPFRHPPIGESPPGSCRSRRIPFAWPPSRSHSPGRRAPRNTRPRPAKSGRPPPPPGSPPRRGARSTAGNGPRTTRRRNPPRRSGRPGTSSPA